MNHPKGEESTGQGEPCSLTYHLSSTLCSAAERSPDNCGTAAGRTFKERNLCGGFRSFFFRQSEAGAALLVGRAERDSADRPHGDDQLLSAGNGQRQESIAGFARERLHREPLAVAELHLDVRALGAVRARVALDL